MDNQPAVSELRKRNAASWMNMSDGGTATAYAGDTGAMHRMLVTRLLAERPEETDIARQTTDRLPDRIVDGDGIRQLLVAMLYNRAYDLPYQYDPSLLPGWILEDYLRYMCNPALLFCEIGEANRYVEYMSRWINFLHRNILENPDSIIWRNIATLFVRCADFGPLYFNDTNLRNLYIQRTDIVTVVLRANGFPVDHLLPERDPSDPLRIGILAPHFEPHPETFAALPFYEHLEPGLEVTLYAMQKTNSDLERYCAGRAKELKVLPDNLLDQVKFIRNDNLDVLYVSSNVTATCNAVTLLVTHRLARAQIAGTGSVTTTGIRNVDYYLTGTLTDAAANTDHYSERLLWLEGRPAHCFSYGTERGKHATRITRSDLGINANAAVFASGANVFKILPELMETWAAILSGVPGSILMLYPYGPNWSDSYPKELFSARLARVLAHRGISEDRLVILDPDPVPSRYEIREYLKTADLYLDSFPFSGSTSLVEPLEASVPVISLQGRSFRSTEGAAILRSINMAELITDSPADYIDLAVQLAIDPDKRRKIKARLATAMQRTPAFLDSHSFSAQVGGLIREIFGSSQVS